MICAVPIIHLIAHNWILLAITLHKLCLSLNYTSQKFLYHALRHQVYIFQFTISLIWVLVWYAVLSALTGFFFPSTLSWWWFYFSFHLTWNSQSKKDYRLDGWAIQWRQKTDNRADEVWITWILKALNWYACSWWGGIKAKNCNTSWIHLF